MGQMAVQTAKEQNIVQTAASLENDVKKIAPGHEQVILLLIRGKAIDSNGTHSGQIESNMVISIQ